MKAKVVINATVRFKGVQDEDGEWQTRTCESEFLYGLKEELETLLIRDCLVKDNFEREIVEHAGVELAETYDDLGKVKYDIDFEILKSKSKQKKRAITSKEATKKFIEILEAFDDKEEREMWLEGILSLQSPVAQKILKRALEPEVKK